MDKILQDVMLQQKKDSAEREAKRKLQRSPRVPQMTPKMRLGTPGSHPMSVGLSPGGTTPSLPKAPDQKLVPVKISADVTGGGSENNENKEQTTPNVPQEIKSAEVTSASGTTDGDKT